MQQLIIPLDWEVAAGPGTTKPVTSGERSHRRPLEKFKRENFLGSSAALRYEVARTASLGGLDESPRPTDVAGYTRSGSSSFFLSQYVLQPCHLNTHI